MAASNIAKFSKAFPDLEEDAINAVYDLCEDQDRNIRIQGYKAIVQMSEEQPRWFGMECRRAGGIATERRTGGGRVIKMALIQHLELDLKALGVLCDQIVPPDDPMEDEVKTIREHLRTLVISFLAQDARMPLLAHLQDQGRGSTEQEAALIDILIKVLSKYPAVDTAKIIEDIFVFLPSFNDGRATRRGNELVQLLLARAASALREDLAPGQNPASLEQSRGYLELSDSYAARMVPRIQRSSCVFTAHPLSWAK